MTLTGKVSRSAWVLLAISGVLFAGVWTVSRRVRPNLADAELITLNSERAQLRECDDATRDALRTQHRARLKHGWTESSLAELPGKFGSNWRCDWKPSAAHERQAIVTRTNPRLSEWQFYADTVRQWSATPGVVLDSFEIATTGVGRHRRFTQVVLGLRFVLGDAATMHAADDQSSDPLVGNLASTDTITSSLDHAVKGGVRSPVSVHKPKEKSS